MNSNTLNSLLKEYEKKKFDADLRFEKARNAFYLAHPDLSSLNDKLNSTAIAISKAILNKDSVLAEKLKKDFEVLKAQKEDLLKTITIPIDAKEPQYECKNCKDTGYVTTENNTTVLCTCIKQKIFDIEFNKANIRKS